MGHGTAVPGNFDLDMVLYSRGIDYNYTESCVYNVYLLRY